MICRTERWLPVTVLSPGDRSPDFCVVIEKKHQICGRDDLARQSTSRGPQRSCADASETSREERQMVLQRTVSRPRTDRREADRRDGRESTESVNPRAGDCCHGSPGDTASAPTVRGSRLLAPAQSVLGRNGWIPRRRASCGAAGPTCTASPSTTSSGWASRSFSLAPWRARSPVGSARSSHGRFSRLGRDPQVSRSSLRSASFTSGGLRATRVPCRSFFGLAGWRQLDWTPTTRSPDDVDYTMRSSLLLLEPTLWEGEGARIRAFASFPPDACHNSGKASHLV